MVRRGVSMNVSTVSKWIVLLLLLMAACSERDTQTSGMAVATTTTIASTTNATTSPVSTRTSTTEPSAATVQLVRLDPLTLDPAAGLDPIAIDADSWNVLSTDGSLLVNFEWDKQARINYGTVIDVANWEQIADVEVGPHAGGITVHGTKAYAYDDQGGRLFSVDVATGQEVTLGDWPSGLYLWDGLHVTPDSRLVALGSSPSDVIDHQAHYSVFVYEPSLGLTNETPIGPIERSTTETGVFDGDYEIPDWDSPGVAWGNDSVFIVYADGPEVIEAHFETGKVQTHFIEATSWLDRLWAFWIPAATAKGPSLGTNSSAALSPDGRYLYISGNEQVVETADDGSLIDESEHLGLTVVDTETWNVVESPDLPIQYVRASNGGVLAVDTISFQPWTSDYYVISTQESGRVAAQGPFTVEGGGCDLTLDLSPLLCIEHLSSAAHIRLIDIDTTETIARKPIGLEDALHPNLILEDRLPEADN